MSDDMRDRLPAEFAEYDAAVMALSNAFGFTDDPSAWADAPEDHVDCWEDAAGAASRVESAADALSQAARRIASTLEEALPEDRA